MCQTTHERSDALYPSIERTATEKPISAACQTLGTMEPREFYDVLFNPRGPAGKPKGEWMLVGSRGVERYFLTFGKVSEHLMGTNR